jgi:PAS domain S-box-containing protein
MELRNRSVGPIPRSDCFLTSAKLRLFLDCAPAAVAIFDRDMRYLGASRRWLETFELDGDVTGRSHYEVFPDIPERWKPIHRRGLSGEVITADEDRFERADGSAYWLRWEVRPWREEDGEVGGVVILLEDIAQRKKAEKAEEALRESEARFRAIFEKAGKGIAIADREGRLQQANPAFCRMLGYSKNELIGRHVFELVHPADGAANARAFQRLRDGETPALEIEHRYLRKDGEPVWVRKSLSLLQEIDSGPECILALVTDITEHRRMAQALRDADRRKDEFLATLAHELRNPLAPIRNAVSVLQRLDDHDPAAKDQARLLIAMAERQVDHLIRLVDDLLEVARIATGKIELKKQHVDLRETMCQAIETAEAVINAGRHTTTISLADQPLTVDGDPVRLAQVFANLLNNAAKYTLPELRIEISMKKAGDEAVVKISDNGIGISAETLPRIFDLFFQTGRAEGHEYGGLGIGLALARDFVEMHGGHVEVHSDGPESGSEFVVRLPLAACPLQGERIEGETTVASVPAPLRVLVVDDVKDVADSVTMLLQLLGADVRVAYNGAAALAVLAGFKPHLALVDIGMPGMDGHETARQIRNLPEGHNLNLVALSGWGRDEDRLRSSEAGFDHHFVKPLGVDVLEMLLASPPVGE